MKPLTFSHLIKGGLVSGMAFAILTLLPSLPSEALYEDHDFVSDPHSGYAGGTGTLEDPYLIATPEQLIYYMQHTNSSSSKIWQTSYVELMADINMDGFDTDTNANNGNARTIGMTYYRDHFDGNGHVIQNLKIINDSNPGGISSSHSNGALFGNMTDYASVKNLGVENLYIEGFQSSGLVHAGYNHNLIENTYTTGKFIGGGTSATMMGGLLASGGNNVSIKSSYSTVEMIATLQYQTANIGGLVGLASSGTLVENSFYEGTITVNYSQSSQPVLVIGGLVNRASSSSVIKNSYSQLDLQINSSMALNPTYSFIGGLAGEIQSSTLTSSYAAFRTNLTDTTLVGGVAAKATSSTITNTYWDSTLGPSTSAAGVGLTTTQMTKVGPKTFMPGFDFQTIWKITDTYPKFHWQPIPALTRSDMAVNGDIISTIVSFSLPSDLTLELNPNLPEGQQVVAPTFEVLNDSSTALTLSLSEFYDESETFTDVLGSDFTDEQWQLFGTQKSRQFALALETQSALGWDATLEASKLYVKTVKDSLTPVALGTLKAHQQASFTFSAKHGRAFNEPLNLTYRLTFIFDLLQ